MLPPIILNNILQLSSATFSKLSSILSSNHQQYCPPTIINIVLQPSSILSSNQHQYCPPTTINIVLQPSSILFPNHHQFCPPTSINIVLQPASILSSKHHQYCPPTIIKIVLQPPSIFADHALFLACPPMYTSVYNSEKSSIWIPVLSHFNETSRTFYKKKHENQSCNSKRTKEKIRWRCMVKNYGPKKKRKKKKRTKKFNKLETCMK